jgi:hypothetical protein
MPERSDSYRWILNNDDFQRWCNDDTRLLTALDQRRPGKGKTMLLRVVNELEDMIAYDRPTSSGRMGSLTVILKIARQMDDW